MKKIFLIVSVLVVASFLNDAYAARQHNQFRTRIVPPKRVLIINNASNHPLEITSECFEKGETFNLKGLGKTIRIQLMQPKEVCEVVVKASDAPNKVAKFKFDFIGRHESKDSSGLDSIKSQSARELRYGIQDMP